MHQAFEAAIDERGQVRVADNIVLPILRRAIVIVRASPSLVDRELSETMPPVVL